MSGAAVGSKLSLKEQSEFIQHLADRCIMLDGQDAGETTMMLTADEARELRALAARLLRISPYEGEIRSMVAGQ